MAILFLGPADSLIGQFLKAAEKKFLTAVDPIDLKFLKDNDVEFIVSHGYRHIVPADIIKAFRGKIINLHISYLPWNRGADPNFWSFVDHTPKGVTVHFMDEGIDTGDIITQKEIALDSTVTLRGSYELLQKELLQLFKQNWPSVRSGAHKGCKQSGKGTYHAAKDREGFEHLLTKGWDTPVSVLEEYAQQNKKHGR